MKNISSLTPFGALLAIAFVLSCTSAEAGQYKLDRKDDPEQGYQFSDVRGVCVAYEKNLASFGELPYGMACGRRLDPKFGFTRPVWRKIDVVSHAELVRSIYRHFRWGGGSEHNARSWLEHVKEMAAKGTTLELAHVDADADGRPDNLVRFGRKRRCNPREAFRHTGPRGRHIVVADAGLTRVLPLSRAISVQGDVILYKGKTYGDVFFGSPEPNVDKYPQLHLIEFTRAGTARICRFLFVDRAAKGRRRK